MIQNTSCFAKFDHPEKFIAPASIWEVHQNPKAHKADHDTITEALLISISTYALCVIANLHNTLMASGATSKWVKIPTLALLTLATAAFAFCTLGEGLIRVAIGIACLPFALLVYLCCNSKILLVPLGTGCYSFVQMCPNFSMVYQLPTTQATLKLIL